MAIESVAIELAFPVGSFIAEALNILNVNCINGNKIKSSFLLLFER